MSAVTWKCGSWRLKRALLGLGLLRSLVAHSWLVLDELLCIFKGIATVNCRVSSL